MLIQLLRLQTIAQSKVSKYKSMAGFVRLDAVASAAPDTCHPN
jgi:hypothetical protein